MLVRAVNKCERMCDDRALVRARAGRRAEGDVDQRHRDAAMRDPKLVHVMIFKLYPQPSSPRLGGDRLDPQKCTNGICAPNMSGLLSSCWIVLVAALISSFHQGRLAEPRGRSACRRSALPIEPRSASTSSPVDMRWCPRPVVCWLWSAQNAAEHAADLAENAAAASSIFLGWRIRSRVCWRRAHRRRAGLRHAAAGAVAQNLEGGLAIYGRVVLAAKRACIDDALPLLRADRADARRRRRDQRARHHCLACPSLPASTPVLRRRRAP